MAQASKLKISRCTPKLGSSLQHHELIGRSPAVRRPLPRPACKGLFCFRFNIEVGVITNIVLPGFVL